MTGQTVKGLHNKTYVIGQELGKGGEGTVYEADNNSAVVVKVYNEQLSADKVVKLSTMAAMTDKAIQDYAAWPTDVVTNGLGQVVGFVMKKVVGAVPLHMLFSPMDRKKIFPDKGYNFLVHVARNVASAFYKLHTAGRIVGDVNEGNILVDNKGMITFIDCDSFQVKNGQTYHFCEVGVPRYTPPELLEKASFENVIRTENTESFSMAILVFQLLFLGRHPFAGKNTTQEEIDEETAIKKHYFAYSKQNKHKLSPPNDSLNIADLPDSLSRLFHKAFETRDERPGPAEWVKELDAFSKMMVVCSATKLHSYSGKFSTCPWCDFKEKRGILYFLDDSFQKNTYAEIKDIESFINGFKNERIHLKRKEADYLIGSFTTKLPHKKYNQYKDLSQAAKIVVAIATIGLAFLHMGFIAAGIILLLFIDLLLPWKKSIIRDSNQKHAEFQLLKNKFEALVKEYNAPKELAEYYNASDTLNRLINQYRKLPEELEARKKKIGEDLFNEQQDLFLSHFYIQNHNIQSFGPGKKALLARNGIVTAKDIALLNRTKVQGIGPVYTQTLLAWRRQMASQFVYKVDYARLNNQYNQATQDINNSRKVLENNIKSEYKKVQSYKAQIMNKQSLLDPQYEQLRKEVSQANQDCEAFKKLLK